MSVAGLVGRFALLYVIALVAVIVYATGQNHYFSDGALKHFALGVGVGGSGMWFMHRNGRSISKAELMPALIGTLIAALAVQMLIRLALQTVAPGLPAFVGAGRAAIETLASVLTLFALTWTIAAQVLAKNGDANRSARKAPTKAPRRPAPAAAKPKAMPARSSSLTSKRVEPAPGSIEAWRQGLQRRQG